MKLWRDSKRRDHEVKWCGVCAAWYITQSCCGNSTCSGIGCDECDDVLRDEFIASKELLGEPEPELKRKAKQRVDNFFGLRNEP